MQLPKCALLLFSRHRLPRPCILSSCGWQREWSTQFLAKQWLQPKGRQSHRRRRCGPSTCRLLPVVEPLLGLGVAVPVGLEPPLSGGQDTGVLSVRLACPGKGEEVGKVRSC